MMWVMCSMSIERIRRNANSGLVCHALIALFDCRKHNQKFSCQTKSVGVAMWINVNARERGKTLDIVNQLWYNISSVGIRSLNATQLAKANNC